MHPIAFLPCTDRHRDLDRQLILAALLLAAGIAVIIGHQQGIEANIRRVRASWDGVELPASDHPAQSAAVVIADMDRLGIDRTNHAFLDSDPGWDYTARTWDQAVDFSVTDDDMVKRFREIAAGVRPGINIRGVVLDASTHLMMPA